jgi:large subunit ribosomal protein L23
MKSIYEIIEKPLITEKSVAGGAVGKYSFRVSRDANKIEVASAVEKLFSVTVLSVNTMTVKGKKSRGSVAYKGGRRATGKTPDWKKAIVTLKAGDKIEIFEGM